MSYKKSSTWYDLRLRIAVKISDKNKLLTSNPTLDAARHCAQQWNFPVPENFRQADNFLFEHRKRIVEELGGWKKVFTSRQLHKIARGEEVRGVEHFMTQKERLLYWKVRERSRM